MTEPDASGESLGRGACLVSARAPVETPVNASVCIFVAESRPVHLAHGPRVRLVPCS